MQKPTILLDIVAGMVLVGLYTPVFVLLYQARWNNIDYSHAYLILPVSLFLAWNKREEVAAALGAASSAAGRAWGLALLVLASLIFFFGWRMDFLMIPTLALIPMLFGIILYRYNGAVARVLSFPILYLLLLVPPPLGVLDAITLPLRKMIAMAAASILGTVLPVHREGMTIYLEQTQIFVGAPCSGLRSLVTMFALALVYVHLIRMERFKKIIVLVAVVPLAMLGNLVRVMVLSLITYFFGKEAGEGFFHHFSGMVVFMIMILGLLWTVKALEGDDDVDL